MLFCCYINGFPINKSEIKQSIKFIEQHVDKKDVIYVSYFASFPFRYYKEISLINMDIKNIVYGKFFLDDKFNYTNKVSSFEVSQLSGRVWFIFSPNIGYEQENMKFLTDSFDSKGERLIQEFHTNGSTVYLYDLNPRNIVEIESKIGPAKDKEEITGITDPWFVERIKLKLEQARSTFSPTRLQPATYCHSV
jgi:hypothetical protein